MKKGKTVIRISAMIILFIPLSIILFLEFFPTVGRIPDKKKRETFKKKTPIFYRKQFHNLNEFRMLTGKAKKKRSERVRPKKKIKVKKTEHLERAKQGELRVTWLGHSSTLVQLGNQNIFLDPVLTKCTSPVSFVGPSRFSEIAMEPKQIPEIDVLFLSHDHYDHLDYRTIKRIKDKVSHYVVPLGVDSILTGWGIDENRIHVLDWWESIEIDGVTYTMIPSRHFAGRNPMKANRTLWGGIHMTDQIHSVYYTGDTGYHDVFEKVYEYFGAVDLMMADSGQYDEAWADSHMNAEQAVQAAKDAHAKWFLPVHWGAFVLSNHAWDEPPKMAVAAAEKLGVNLATPRIGQTVDYDEIATFHEHWWEGERD